MSDSDGTTTRTEYARFAEPRFAESYLGTFYRSVIQDEVQLATFLAREYEKVTGRPEMLEVGSGPCVARAMQAVPHVSSIVLADYLADNRDAIRRWRDRAPGAHDWTEFTRLALELEGGSTSDAAVAAREDALRDRIDSIRHVDLLADPPLADPRTFDLVGAFFCLDSASATMAVWEQVMVRVANLISPGGRLFASLLHGTDHYVIEDARGATDVLRQVRLTEADVHRGLLLAGFDPADTVVEVAANTDMESHGYDAITMISAARVR